MTQCFLVLPSLCNSLTFCGGRLHHSHRFQEIIITSSLSLLLLLFFFKFIKERDLFFLRVLDIEVQNYATSLLWYLIGMVDGDFGDHAEEGSPEPVSGSTDLSHISALAFSPFIQHTLLTSNFVV